MAFEKTYDDPEIYSKPACVHLRSKAMYVTGQLDPSHPDEAGSHYCWCNCTQHTIGPDRVDVDRAKCVVGRECFRETR